MEKETAKNIRLCAIIIACVLIIDQTVKIIVKTNMYLGQDIAITPWFHVLFVENNGMAFGMEVISKLFLSLFRIAAIIFIGYYLYKLSKRGIDANRKYIASVSLIFAGALGNVIDCMFYGIVFDDPFPPFTATLFPEWGGYATFLHGRVVDMLYFPLFSFTWPDWVPQIGGNEFLFFRPIFNIADTAITIGVLVILLFQRKSLSSDLKTSDDNA